ncbi:hypothetical protein D3P08_10650 [Paenibacillus nanensis]|uniref:Nucleotidyl transferase domain-containing protein n=1 Tax=Paenibacillus nanensis TaxID=393251 RepID=A0A3A1V0W4_9BACL|nr:sugar phosphate nucleotidyltransferase [Paenibacillus nanensis]RIX53092.1 hypothetical protein D3P08_10650 [Paenibacillus nanensis]
MKIVILSGGPGKRVWPLSDNSMPKQYLPVLDGPGGKQESMVQRLWRQLMTADLMEETSISTCGEQVAPLKRLLGPNVPLICEPAQRGSYSAALLTASYLYTVAGVTPNETVIVLPVDFYVEGEFFHCIRSLPKLLRESGSSVMMVGAKAEHPSPRYGYIVPDPGSGEDWGYDSKVKDYYEKPSEAEAETLAAQGALWNSGVYAFRLEFLLSRLSEAGLPVHYEELYNRYFLLPKISMEDGLIADPKVEKSVIRYDGLWVSLSTWSMLSRQAVIPN